MLQMLLESASVVVRSYESAEVFIEEFRPNGTGCILLDLRLPGIGGVGLIERLRSTGNLLPIIVISGHANVSEAVRAMKLGAIDVLQKPLDNNLLVSLVKNALKKSVDSLQIDSEEATTRERFAVLTARELDVVKLLVGGSSNKQIAALLRISIKTVANHRARVMDKTQAINSADLARMATLVGVLPGGSVRNSAGHLELSGPDRSE